MKKKFCIWVEHFNAPQGATWRYVTGCTNVFFMSGNTAQETKFRFCPYCGKKLLHRIEEGLK